MIGIKSFGMYVPLWRLPLNLISPNFKGEKAVAGQDEDSVTMAVAAVINCLNGMDRNEIDGVFFASTTAPYKEKQCSTIIAAAADFKRDILTADFAGTLKAGTSAILAAVGAVKAGMAKKIIVVASDARLASPKSDIERTYAEGAAAVLISEDAVAGLEANNSVANELIDVWRADGDAFVRSWEDRFLRTEGAPKIIPEAVTGLFNKAKVAPKDITKAIFPITDAKLGAEVAKTSGFDPKTQLQDSLGMVLGNMGTAYPIFLLIAALEEAKTGDRLLLAGYGNGSDALLFKVNDGIEKAGTGKSIKAFMDSKRLIPDYYTYLTWRGLVHTLPPLKPHEKTDPAPPPIARERERIYPLHGGKCKVCGTIEFPPQRVCGKCFAKDNYEPIRLSDKKGNIFSFSYDGFWGDFKALVNFEGGGRIFCYVTDVADINELSVEQTVEMSFRKLFSSGGIHNYYWKAIPVRF